MRSTLISTLMLIGLAAGVHGQRDLLNRVPALQETARNANGGASGCGVGTITLVTSKGEIRVRTGLDPIHVFGRTVAIADLMELLDARVRAIRSDEKNPMSAGVSDLSYVILSTIGHSSDPAAIPVVTKLLDDPDDVIRGWSLIALIRLAETSDDLRKAVESIEFPKAAVQSAGGRGVKLPNWAKIKG